MSKQKDSMSLKRLKREAAEIMASPVPGIEVNVCYENFYKWSAKLLGPANSPYEKGVFDILIKFELTYPLEPPKVTFVTKIFHCNINCLGQVCLDLLKDKWTPLLTVQAVLQAIQQLLREPNPDDPLMPSIGSLLKKDPTEYNRRAKLLTLKYAMKK